MSERPEGTGVGEGDASLARPLDWRFGIALTLAFLLVTFPRAITHVPWRDEWHTWQVVTTTRDFGAMIAQLRYDGHPPLWYAMLWLAAGVTSDVLAMKLVHATIAACTVGVIAVAAPLSRGRRVLLAGGYFFAFEYAVISRNYGLGLLWLFVAVAIAWRRPRAYLAVAGALALAVQSNAFAAILACTIAAWMAVRWWGDGRPLRGRFAGGCAVMAASLALAAWTTRAAPDIVNSPANLDFSAPQVSLTLASMWRAFAPVPLFDRAWWNSNLLDITRPMYHVDVVQGTLGVAVFALAVAILPARRGVRALWAAGALIILAFFYLKVVGTTRHQGHIFAGFLLAWWLGAPTAAERDASPTSWRHAALTILLVVQAGAGVFASVADVQQPFSASRATAAFIAARYPDAAIVGHKDYTTASVAGALGRPLYYAQAERWGTFIVWDRHRDRDAEQTDLTAAASSVAAARPGQVALLVLSLDAPNVPDLRRFKPVARFDDSSIADERYIVFEFLAPPPPATQRDTGRTLAR